jgi:hypothetical protein
MCGQHHDGLLTDQAYKLPDAVWAIPEAIELKGALQL